MRFLRYMAVLTMLACAGAAGAQSVKFENKTKKIMNVFTSTGEGKCPEKPQPVRRTFVLNPGESREVAAVGREKEICWAASTHRDISQFPLYCGSANANGVVTFSKESKLCDAKPLRSSPATQRVVAAVSGARQATVEVHVGGWNDPLTPPQTRTRCINEAWGHWPWCEEWHTCNEWATDCRFMRVDVFLIATSPEASPEQLKNAIDACLKEATVAAALAGVVAAIASGGSAAIAAAEEAFKDVLLACLAGKLTVDIRFDSRSGWTNWGSCT